MYSGGTGCTGIATPAQHAACETWPARLAAVGVARKAQHPKLARVTPPNAEGPEGQGLPGSGDAEAEGPQRTCGVLVLAARHTGEIGRHCPATSLHLSGPSLHAVRDHRPGKRYLRIAARTGGSELSVRYLRPRAERECAG